MLEQIAISYFKDLPEPGFELTSPVSPALASRFFTSAPPEPLTYLPVSPFALSQEFSLHTLPKGSFSNIAELITSVVISGGFPNISSGKESIFQCRRCKKWV